jgi:2-keto-4-pentenoate hydratase/2-oxohepta-3-ene-1,7-dioic acid hydratase in catechol pathway
MIYSQDFNEGILMSYRHKWTNGDVIPLPIGKVVCVGRNYAEHAKELNNPVLDEPLIFMKPATSMVEIQSPIIVDWDKGTVHHELEISILIGEELKNCNRNQARAAAKGVGMALDLTFRDMQRKLKKNGHPWEKAKSFDASCPLSPFVPAESFETFDAITFQLTVNGEARQKGSSAQMLTDIVSLIRYISHWFTLKPGDVVLTGTPAGVGPLFPGDEMQINLQDFLFINTTVRAA